MTHRCFSNCTFVLQDQQLGRVGLKDCTGEIGAHFGWLQATRLSTGSCRLQITQSLGMRVLGVLLPPDKRDETFFCDTKHTLRSYSDKCLSGRVRLVGQVVTFSGSSDGDNDSGGDSRGNVRCSQPVLYSSRRRSSGVAMSFHSSKLESTVMFRLRWHNSLYV